MGMIYRRNRIRKAETNFERLFGKLSAQPQVGGNELRGKDDDVGKAMNEESRQALLT